MKDYHFQENDQDFGLTVRLDSINEKVKQLNKKEDEDDELGDANAFLDAFESEKFDTPAEADETDDELGDTRQLEPVKRPEPVLEEEEEEEWDEDEEYEEGEGGIFGLAESYGVSRKTTKLLIVLGIIACIVGFSLVRCSFHPSKTTTVATSENGTPMLVQADRGDGQYLVYDIVAEEGKTVLLTDKTKITNELGHTDPSGTLKEGDLVLAELDKDGKKLLTVDYSGEAIQTEEATGLEVNTKKHTLSNDAENIHYEYSDEAMFFYEDEEIRAKELEPCDVLLLKMVDDMVWSVEVQEYHGYIIVENAKSIKDGEIQLDEEDPMPLEEGMQIAAKEGSHTVTVTGSNIETRKDTLLVEAGEEFEYDLSKAQEKVGVIIINANVSDYKLYVNGAAAESPAVLPMGEYDLVILKNGYTEWNQHVTLDQDTLNVTAELQKDIQYGTLTITADVDGAWVYINGEEYGVAPMQVNLPYGSYNVMLEKSGYANYRQTIQIQSGTATLHAVME